MEPISTKHIGLRVRVVGPKGRGRWQGRITELIGKNLTAAAMETDAGKGVTLLVQYWRVVEVLGD